MYHNGINHREICAESITKLCQYLFIPLLGSGMFLVTLCNIYTIVIYMPIYLERCGQ